MDPAIRRVLSSIAETVDPVRVEAIRVEMRELLAHAEHAVDVATALSAAYPSVHRTLQANPELAVALDGCELEAARTRADLLASLRGRLSEDSEDDEMRRVLRHFARFERLRVALRELLPDAHGGADVDVTAGELSALADVTIEVALEDAIRHVSRRCGEPTRADGARSRFAVLGMGKLGGQELNSGSDVDLIYLYDTDDGAARRTKRGVVEETTLQEFWTRVAKRLTSTLEDVTEDGFVWRVDLRLRPEGARGALVASLSAMEQYYESFGRLWERAALLRARPSAGDLDLGDELLESLLPFVWRRRIDPSIAVEMIRLVHQARAELTHEPDADLKLGEGGIREAEFFVQSLALIWGGREPSVRARGTLEALSRLGVRGFVTDREGAGMFDAYLALRRAEHAVQFSSGIQTHELPKDPDNMQRLARVLGFDDSKTFLADLDEHRGFVAARFASLAPGEDLPTHAWPLALSALDEQDIDAFIEAIDRVARRAGLGTGPAPGQDWSVMAHSLFELSRHPDALLGLRSREAFPALADTLLDALMDAADPDQAARYLRAFWARLRFPGVYIRMLGADPRVVRRLVGVLGASAFVGDAIATNPELGDLILFTYTVPTPESARDEILLAHGDEREDPEESLVGALRRAKARVTLQVALADLAGDIDVRDATVVLSALADASLEAATRFALGVGPNESARGLTVVAMGKLGGREIGYGSDLDVIFVYEPQYAPPGKDAAAYFTRVARTIIRVITSPHGAGSGYELDTRLRPSGNQGLLVTSVDAFAKYHAVHAEPSEHGAARKGAAWERMALLRARAVAGDEKLGERVIEIARQTAYGVTDPAGTIAQELHRIRTRVVREASLERPGRHDLKLGWGGLLEIEFSVQMRQMCHPEPREVMTTETPEALELLAMVGALTPRQASDLIDGYYFLRLLEQRIRVVHADASHLLDEHAPGLEALARRMDFREQPGLESVTEQLLEMYREVTSRVRKAYEEIVVGS